MKKEEFIEVLKRNNYLYEIQGDKIIVTHEGYVYLNSLETLPPGVEFKNDGGVGLRSLKTLPPGVEFRNDGNVYLEGILGGWLNRWECNIEGVDDKRLLNLMANKELFL